MKEKKNKKSFGLKILKITGWVLFSIVLLLIAVILAIRLPPVQNKLVQKAITFLEKKIGTDVSLDYISISFPKTIVLEGLYLQDLNKDTLLYAGNFSVDTDLWALTRREIQLNEISLENAKAYINRPANDSSYNFSYILKAFVGDSTAVQDTTKQKAGWKFSIEDIAFENIKASYQDYLTGNFLNLNLGNLDVSISEFNLDKMKIVVDEINLINTTASVVQTKQPEVTEEVAEEINPITYDIGVSTINLENIQANFDQQALGKFIRLDLGKSVLKTDRIDLKENKIDLSSFMLSNTFLSFQQRLVSSTVPIKLYDPEPVREKKLEESKPWTISLIELDLSGNSIQLYDYTKPQIRGAIDFDHLWLTNFNMRASNVVVKGTAIKVDLKNLAFREKSGFTIHSMRAGLDVQQKQVDVNNLLLITGNSRMEIAAHATFPSLTTISENFQQAKFRADINQSSIAWRDLLYFNPSIADSIPLNIPSHLKIHIDGSLKGSVGNMNINHLAIRALSKTYLRTSGRITGLPDATKLRMDILLDKFYTTKADLAKILPDTLIPKSLDIPEWLNIHGVYEGSLDQSSFITFFTSNIGAIDLKGNIDLDSTSASRGFNADLNVKDFDLGRLLLQPDTIGIINLEASVNAKGLKPEEITGEIRALVRDFEFHQYRYENFKLDGKVNEGVYAGLATLKDENLKFSIEGNLDYSDAVPMYNITFDLKNANFKALHLSERPLKARGILTTNMATGDFKTLNGTLGLRQVAIFNGETLYAVDSLLFASIDQKGKSELKIDSDLLTANFEGTFNIFSMGDVLKEYFSTYYSIHDSTLIAKKDSAPQHFKFYMKLKKTELLTDILVPQLESFVPGEIKGEFDSDARKLDMTLDISQIKYSNIGVTSFLFSVNSDAFKLNYNILADEIKVDSLKIDGLEFNGTVANDSIRTNLIILDSIDNQKYLLGGIFHSLENEYEFHFLPDQVKLNYVDWTVPIDNYLRFGGPKIVAKDIRLQNGNEKIIIDSQEDAASTLLIGFRELNLEYLVSMVSKEKPVSGLLHGDIYLVPDTANMTFTADLGIRDFNISEIPWGDITLSVDRKTSDRFEVDFSVQSDRNDIKANGFYITGENSQINLRTIISRFDLMTVEPLTMGQLKDLKGMLSGEVNIQGSTKSPLITGGFTFNDVQFFSTYLNSPFSLDNETIALTRRGVEFDNFDLLDTRKNKATVDGVIETKDYKDFSFRLDLVTNNFRLINTTVKDNELFYGKVDVDATIKVRGKLDEPSVSMQVGLGDDSKLTYVVPQTDAGVMEQEGIVRFVDKTFKNDPFMKTFNVADTVKSDFRGINLTARIELTDKESFTVIIDPTTGDQLTVRGNTTLTLDMDPTGDMDLSGRYEITEGTYNLSFYKFLKREFKIEKGSSMVWAGDPLNAQLDMSAVYEVETAPIDLLSTQLTGSDQQEINRYKQRLPFQVYLNIKGELLKPDISFKLDMPSEERDYAGGNVYSRITDINTRESDLNKQVFALLILKRFISDNPFENQGGGGVEGTARTSVSKLLTAQLNRLSQNVRGVELSFDVKSYEDYSSGQAQGQTQLQLGLSKNLFNDRLVVKVAGNVGVEGANQNQEVTDYIGDLALEYKLTEDGRFRITGFRNSNYDMIDGQLTETGTGLIFIKDYNVLGELFKANAKEKKK